MLERIQEIWRDNNGIVLAVAGVLIMALAVGGYLLVKRPEDVSNPDAAFVEEPEQEVVELTNWPLYGLNPERTRYLNSPDVKAPYKIRWKYKGNKLLEYSPVLAGHQLYAVNNNGRAYAIKTRTGKARWKREIAALNASAPAYDGHILYISNLEPGQVQARMASGGEQVWVRELPGRTESSPVVVGNLVIAGCECGTLYAFDKLTGKTVWETELSGEIKAAPAVSDGIVYVGTYGGQMHAINAQTGEEKWSSGSQGGGLGATGRFYATAAIGFGRVYAGSLDGRMYSFEKETGELAWSHSTGGYVYAGAALANVPGLGPTVYFGSYDGTFYALDAKSGDERWTDDVGGSISGAGSVIGNTVYVAELTDTETHGYDVKTGKETFTFRDGAYNPVISDGASLYVTGYKTIYKLNPIKAGGQKAAGQQIEGGVLVKRGKPGKAKGAAKKPGKPKKKGKKKKG